MVTFLSILTFLLLAAGASLCAYAMRRYATETERNRSAASRQGWSRILKSRRRFTTDTGYRLYVIGLEMIVVGAFLMVVIAWNL